MSKDKSQEIVIMHKTKYLNKGIAKYCKIFSKIIFNAR